MTRASARFVLVVSLEPLDASTTLFFRHLEWLMPGAIRVVQYGRDDIAGALGAAAAVVLVRGLFEFSDVARCARVLRIPLFYFIDDNFMALRDHGGISAEFVTRYTESAVRAALRGFAGVLFATPALLSYFAERRLHENLRLFPPVSAGRGAPRPDRTGATVAFFGGRHLHHQLVAIIVPALRRLGRQRPVRLVAVGLPEPIAASEGFVVTHRAYDVSYARGLHALQGEGVDVLVHPVATGVTNNAYKNPHALISARTLDAIPVVSNAPPYDTLGAEGVALICEDTEEGWYQALAQATTDPSLRTTVAARLEAFCADHYSGSQNQAIVNAMLLSLQPRSWAHIRWRSAIAHGCLAMSMARRAAGRLTRAAGLKMVAA